jgi:hypothetical protein
MPDDAALASPAPEAVISLRSDPPWLRLGLLALTLALTALMALYFRSLPSPRPHPALAILPGLALATFAGAWLAYWGRSRGGSLHLEVERRYVVLSEPRSRQEVVDRLEPFGAWLIRDPKSGHRVLVLSQGGAPLMLYERAPSQPVEGIWKRRHLEMDLGSIALSPASAHVYTLSRHATLEPLLAALGQNVGDENAPYLLFGLPSGETLRVGASGMRAGDRAVPLEGGDLAARRITVQSAQGDVVGLSVVAGETSFLLACQDPGDTLDAASASDAPDGYLPATVWGALASLYHVAPGESAIVERSYRG